MLSFEHKYHTNLKFKEMTRKEKKRKYKLFIGCFSVCVQIIRKYEATQNCDKC